MNTMKKNRSIVLFAIFVFRLVWLKHLLENAFAIVLNQHEVAPINVSWIYGFLFSTKLLFRIFRFFFIFKCRKIHLNFDFSVHSIVVPLFSYVFGHKIFMNNSSKIIYIIENWNQRKWLRRHCVFRFVLFLFVAHKRKSTCPLHKSHFGYLFDNGREEKRAEELNWSIKH